MAGSCLSGRMGAEVKVERPSSTQRRHNIKHEARLTRRARSMQGRDCSCGKSFELGAGQQLLSMRLLGLVLH